MDNEETSKDIRDLRERVIRIESSIENILQQQTVVESLAKSVHEIVLSLKEITFQTNSNTKKLDAIETDARKKNFYIWCTVVGGILGAVIGIVTAQAF